MRPQFGLSYTDKSVSSSGGLGPELVTNGDFSGGATGWDVVNISGGTSITGGAGVFNDPADDGDAINQSAMTLEAGHTYRVVFSITARTGGSLPWAIGSASGTTRSTVGTFTEDVVAANTTPLSFGNSGSPRLTIDNVSVQEVL